MSREAALDLVERIVQKPPTRLSELEALVGPLHVDFAGREAMGHFTREAAGPRTKLPPGLGSLTVRHVWDMHHEDPHRPRDLVFVSVEYSLLVPSADVEAVLSRALGEGERIVHAETGDLWQEHGRFYLRTEPSLEASLLWELRRPDWTAPRAAADVRSDLLRALKGRLGQESKPQRLLALLQPHLVASGATARLSRAGLDLTFLPRLPVAQLVEVFRWPKSVAYATDVHMASWRVAPSLERPEFRVGVWLVKVLLASWPRGPGGARLEEVGRIGPSPCLSLAGCTTDVQQIAVESARPEMAG